MSGTLNRPMFPGFRHEQIDIGEVTINAVVGRLFKPLDEWRNVATQVRGKALPCGHYIPEEVPDLLVDELLNFFEGGL